MEAEKYQSPSFISPILLDKLELQTIQKSWCFAATKVSFSFLFHVSWRLAKILDYILLSWSPGWKQSVYLNITGTVWSHEGS